MQLSTLDPSKYTLKDTLDLSGYSGRTFILPGSSPSLRLSFRLGPYKYPHKLRRVPFPAGTKGILYFRDRTSTHPLAGDIRFRILPLDTVHDWSSVDTAELFARGHDLLDDTGCRPWRISLASIIHTGGHGLCEAMKAQGYITAEAELAGQALPHALSQVGTNTGVRKRQILEKVTDPFVLDLSTWSEMFLVLTKEGVMERRIIPRQVTCVREDRLFSARAHYSGMILGSKTFCFLFTTLQEQYLHDSKWFGRATGTQL